MSASASILTLTSMAEVVVRNALDRTLEQRFCSVGPGQSWFDIAPLDERGRKDVQVARTRAGRHSKDLPPHGKVIAELSLGFWRFLVESRYYTSLWVPATWACEDAGAWLSHTATVTEVVAAKQRLLAKVRQPWKNARQSPRRIDD